MADSRKWVVPSRQKLTAFLKERLGGSYSGKFLRKLLELNLCRVNGRVERFGSKEVEAGSVVELAPNWKDFLHGKNTEMQIVYEDEDLLIVNKRDGWVCTDLEAGKTFGPHRYLVHRLDKTTTGLLILAKSLSAKDAMIELFEKREVFKSYLAVVDGTPAQKEGVKETLLAKKGSFEGQTIWGSSSTGLEAVTYWKVLAEGEKAALMQCVPVTGRTHQIRVHMAELGHPILVDRQYAKNFRCRKFAARPLLHAYQLRFLLKGRQIDVTAPLFSDMEEFLKSVGIQMAFSGEPLREIEHEGPRKDRKSDKDRKKMKKGIDLAHQRSKLAAGVVRNSHAKIPNPNPKRLKAGGSKPSHQRKTNRRK